MGENQLLSKSGKPNPRTPKMHKDQRQKRDPLGTKTDEMSMSSKVITGPQSHLRKMFRVNGTAYCI